MYICTMRIITVGTIKTAIKKYPAAEQSLLSWFEEAKNAEYDKIDAKTISYVKDN